jgi:hypothetical protein
MANLTTRDIFKKKQECYLLLHLAHINFPAWNTALVNRGWTSLPPVVVVGTRPKYKMHRVNPIHMHETWYPFRRSLNDNGVPDALVVNQHCEANRWRSIYVSAHKADLGLSTEERKAVNEATGYGGESGSEAGEQANFRCCVM